MNKQREVPLYIKIENDLRFKINSDQWSVGSKLPSESELEELYSVSRITIRRALADLTESGYLSRERGRGTFVLAPGPDFQDKQVLTVIKSFTEEMLELGKEPITTWAHIRPTQADERIAKHLNLSVGAPVMQLERIRGTKDEVLTYSETFFPFNHHYSTNSQDYYGSFYEYLETFGIRADQLTEYLEAIPSNERLMRLLNMSHPAPLLRRVRHAQDSKSDYVEYSTNYYVGARYRYYIHP
ncbi:MAG: GntR family transcriptional regulator [Lacticaseibacillus paracasei]